MSAKVWNGEMDVLTVLSGGTNSTAFSVPNSAVAVTIYFPLMTSVAASGSLQALTPPDQDGMAEVWLDMFAVPANGGAPVALNALIAAGGATRAVTISVDRTGGGVLRIGGLEAQAGAREIRLFWSKRNN